MSPRSSRTARLSPERLAQFEGAILRFEQEWAAGRRPVIEAFLPDDGDLRPVLLAELIHVEREFLGKAGEPASAEEYLQRFPELAADQSCVQDLAETAQAVKPAQNSIHVAGDGRLLDRARQASPAGKPDVRIDQRLLASRLVSEEQLRECLKAVAREGKATVDQVRSELLRRGWVTAWQWNQLRKGQTSFFVDEDRYLLCDLIGQGGMGTVYKARHVRMNRDVALKVIDLKRVNDQRLIDRFRREVEVTSRLQHEHIVQAHDVGIHAGAMFLVLEFVEGSDLASLVRRDGSLQPDEAAAIVMQAAAGLVFAHAHGIIHRDIKPQNILLSTSGIVKILDMGLARVLDDPDGDRHTSLTEEGTVMGTVDYMSPEQARNSRLADGRSDIYSLGATLYALLAGRPPFAGGAAIEKLHRLANESPPPISEFRIDCPRGLEAIVERMLAKRPEDRFQSTVDVIRALHPFAAEKIAGRQAVTSAVQSAAETMHGEFTTENAAAIGSFIPVDDSFATTKLRLQSQRGSPRKIAVGTAVATVLFAAVAIWGFSGKEKKASLTGNDKVPAKKSATRLPPARIVRELPGHFGGPTSLAWSPDAVHLAVGSLDGDVHIRVMGFAEPITRYEKHRSSVVGVIWLPKGDLIASTEAAGDIHVWHAFTGETRHVVKRNRIDSAGSLVASHGSMMGLGCSPNGGELCYSNGNNIIRLSIPGFEPLGSLPLEGQNMHDFRYSPSGKLLATSSAEGHSEYLVTVTNLHAGNVILQIKGLPETETNTGAAEFLSGAFRSEDELAVIRPRRLEVWNVSTGKVVREFPIETGTRTNSYQWTSTAEFLANASHFALWTPDGLNLISTQDGTLRRMAAPFSGGTTIASWRLWDFTRDMRQVAKFGQYSPGLEIIRLADGHRECPWGNEWFGAWNGHETQPPRVHGDVLLQLPPEPTWDLRTGELRDDLAGKKLFTISPAGNLWILEDDRVRTLANEAGKTDEIAPPIMIEDAEPGGYFWSGDRRRLFQARGDTLHAWESESGRKIGSFRAGLATYGNSVTPRYDGRTVGMSYSARHALIAEPYDKPPELIPAPFPTHLPFSFSARNEYLASYGVIFRIADRKKFAIENQALTIGWNGSFSRTGEYLLVDHCIWQLSGNAPEKIWICPEVTRAVHSLNFCPSFFANCWFDDEEQVVLMQDASIGIWRWRENRKRATLYFLPERNWAFVNHETQHWNGTPGADRYLRYERQEGDTTLRLKPADDRKRFRWKNDPEKAGLDLGKRHKESKSKTDAN